MAGTEEIKQAIAQAVFEATKVTALAITRDVRRYNIHPEWNGASLAIRHRIWTFPRQPIFNWTATHKHVEPMNFKMEVKKF